MSAVLVRPWTRLRSWKGARQAVPNEVRRPDRSWIGGEVEQAVLNREGVEKCLNATVTRGSRLRLSALASRRPLDPSLPWAESCDYD